MSVAELLARMGDSMLKSEERRSALFWKGYDEELGYNHEIDVPVNDVSDEVLKGIIMSLYGNGPRSGGKCRSDVAKLLGMDFHFVDRIIKEAIRERKRNVRISRR